MKYFKKILTLCITTTLLAAISLQVSAKGHAAKWQLVKDESIISFVSIKKGSVGEAHTFTDFSGLIDHNNATVTIKADSVDTNVPIRNERAREFLFETGIYPTISITSDVSAAMKVAKKGATKMTDLPATLSMHGISKEVSLNISVSRNGKGTISVASTKPVIIKAADYNMDAGVTKLAELVGSIPIASAVPVSFVLTFKKDKK